MKTPKKYDGSVKVIGEGRYDVVQVVMKLTATERSAFLRNPTGFFTRFLAAHKEVTNEFIASEKALRRMVSSVRKARAPVSTHMTIHAHVTSPKKYKSRRITIVTH